jgi:hypothetical protein
MPFPREEEFAFLTIDDPVELVLLAHGKMDRDGVAELVLILSTTMKKSAWRSILLTNATGTWYSPGARRSRTGVDAATPQKRRRRRRDAERPLTQREADVSRGRSG